jgi:hypothetical protein
MHQTRRALLASLLVAVAVSLGYALAAVPNVELMTLTVFVSGFLLGPKFGVGVGAASMLLFSMFNPMGAALPPLLLAQAVGQAVVGFSGGVLGPRVARAPRKWPTFVVAGSLGFFLTLFYDVATNVGAYFVIAGEKNISNLPKFVAGGILFVSIHIVWNTMIFGLMLKPCLNVLELRRRELSGE